MLQEFVILSIENEHAKKMDVQTTGYNKFIFAEKNSMKKILNIKSRRSLNCQ